MVSLRGALKSPQGEEIASPGRFGFVDEEHVHSAQRDAGLAMTGGLSYKCINVEAAGIHVLLKRMV